MIYPYLSMISGFGKTEGTANDRVLNQQTLPIVKNSVCNSLNGAGTVPDNTQMCAGYRQGFKLSTIYNYYYIIFILDKI